MKTKHLPRAELRSHPFTMVELRSMGLRPVVPPERCPRGHLCELLPCVQCAVENYRANHRRKGVRP